MRNLAGIRKQLAVIAVIVCLTLSMLPGCASTSSQHTASDLQEAKVVRVVDGDTLIVNTNGVDERVRLIGVDTPESVNPDESKNTAEGKAASEHTKSLLKTGTKVWLEADSEDRDKYDRLLRYVWLEAPEDPGSEREAKEKMLNTELVKDGWADPMTIEPNTKWAYLFQELASGR